jgi:16S rRNA (cytidine1402-2'-O)-methyltransferase
VNGASDGDEDGLVDDAAGGGPGDVMGDGPGDGPSGVPAGLVLAATPLGDSRDASLRLREALATADVVAAEDTRRLRSLAAALGVTVRGRVVVTDAGMPAVSDPGYRLVAAAAAEELPVTCLPGPSAVTTALVLSGLPVERFCFEGFAPRRDGERRRWLATLLTEPRAVVFFESPHRLADTLAAAVDVLGASRGAAVCRELTKKYEEVRRGTLAALAAGAVDDPVRGEVTVVLAGAAPAAAQDVGTLVGEVHERVAAGERLKDAAAAVALAAGVPKRELYNASLVERDGG